MRKFLLKASLFVVGLLLITNLLAYKLEAWVKRPTNVYSDYKKQFSGFLSRSNQLEVITAGHSHSKAIDFGTMDIKNGYHLWRPGADIFEIQYQLEALLPKLDNLELVLISTSYLTFHWENQTVEDYYRRAMYAVIPSYKFIDGDFVNYVLGKTHKILPWGTIARADHWDGVFKALNDEKFRQSVSSRAADGQMVNSRYLDCKYLSGNNLIRKTQENITSADLLVKQLVKNKPNLSQLAYIAFSQMVENLQSYEIRVIFYMTPLLRNYKEQINPEQVRDTDMKMKELQETYDIEFYNFSSDPDFAFDNTLFHDTHHLNLCGAKKFSARLKEIIDSQ